MTASERYELAPRLGRAEMGQPEGTIRRVSSRPVSLKYDRSRHHAMPDRLTTTYSAEFNFLKSFLQDRLTPLEQTVQNAYGR